MWQYKNTDELYPYYNTEQNDDEIYHYGVLGMKWHHHIYRNDKPYRSLGQRILQRKLKSIDKKDTNYNKLKKKIKKIKKRDNIGYSNFLKKEKVKQEKKQEIKDKKQQNKKYNKKIESISLLTDEEINKQNRRLQSENEYYRLKQINDSYKKNENTTKKILGAIGNKIVKPAVTEAGKNVLQDLLTELGKSTNVEINRSYKNMLKKSKR